MTIGLGGKDSAVLVAHTPGESVDNALGDLLVVVPGGRLQIRIFPVCLGLDGPDEGIRIVRLAGTL